jgi:hypothetical protein
MRLHVEQPISKFWADRAEAERVGETCSCLWHGHTEKQIWICRYHEAQEAKIARLQKQIRELKAKQRTAGEE